MSRDEMIKYIQEQPELSTREMASRLHVSHMTISRLRRSNVTGVTVLQITDSVTDNVTSVTSVTDSVTSVTDSVTVLFEQLLDEIFYYKGNEDSPDWNDKCDAYGKLLAMYKGANICSTN